MLPETKPHVLPQTPVEQPQPDELTRRGINPKTYEFLTVCISLGTHQNITSRQRNLIGIYYGTKSSLADLQKLAQTNNKQTVKNQISSGMKSMWQNLPQETRQTYPPQKTLLLKKTGSRRGKTHSEEARARMSAAQRENWQDPQYRARISAARRENWQDPQYRARISAARRGKTRSEETRARMSAAQRNRRAKEKGPGTN